MSVKGHILLASAISLGVNQYFFHLPLPKFLYIYLGILLGAILPDIDEPNSFIAKKLSWFSTFFNAIFKHRTLTHYLIFSLLIAYASKFIPTQKPQWIVFGIAIGTFLHAVGDMLTKRGIRGFFFPLFPRTNIALLPKYLRFKSHSKIEKLFIFLLILFHLYLLDPHSFQETIVRLKNLGKNIAKIVLV